MASNSSLAWERVFTVHHEKFNTFLNLGSLLPKLNSRELLSRDELDQLTLPTITTGQKVTKLVQILNTKGQRAPAIVIECLRNETNHPSHLELADSMEEFLQHRSELYTTPNTIPGSIIISPPSQTTVGTNPTQQCTGPHHQADPLPRVSTDHQTEDTHTNIQDHHQPPAVQTLRIDLHVHGTHTSSISASAPQPLTEQTNYSQLVATNNITDGGSYGQTTVSSIGTSNNCVGGASCVQPMVSPITHNVNTIGGARYVQPTVSPILHNVNTIGGASCVQPMISPILHNVNTIGGARYVQPTVSPLSYVQPTFVPAHPIPASSLDSGPHRSEPSSYDDYPVGNSPSDQLRQVAPMYATMIDHLASELNSKLVSIHLILHELNVLLQNENISISLPAEEIRDFPSLCLCLRNCGICHEMDVDLLCKLLLVIRLEDLHQIVKQYAEGIMGNNVLQSQPSVGDVRPTDTHFLMLTFHNVSSMNLAQAIFVKDHIANILQVPRHTFTLASSRIGSIVLVWRVPNMLLKRTRATFGEVEISSKLGLTDVSSIKLEFLYERELQQECVYTCAEPSTDAISSADETVSSTTRDFTSDTMDSRPSGLKRSPPPHSRDLGPPSNTRQRLSSSPHEFASQYIPNRVSQGQPPPTDERTPLQVLAATLKETYRSKNFFKRAAGPKAGKKIEFINLALVKKQRVSQDDRERDEFLTSTLHGSIDDIVKKKEEIKLEAIFEYDNGDEQRKLVLVEGAPGVGKTMLAMKICQEWANGKLLQDEYDLVFLVTLRRFQGKPFIELKDLVNIAIEGEVGEKASQDLYRSQGEKMLFVLEGWDELPPSLREESTLFLDIIEGTKLPKASVLVTSRPTVTAPLYDYMDERHIEVLGFSPQQIREYVRKHGKDKVELILDHLKKFPNLAALAHIPLTLSIICHVIHERSVLPPTLTELYDSYICNALFQSLKKHPSETLKTLIGLGSLEELPSDVRGIIKSLCKLALDGFEEKKIVYSLDDLHRVDLKVRGGHSFDGFGLLTTPINTSVAGFEQVFQFRHLSIQEFLAAYGIKQLAHGERVELLRKFRDDKQFRNIWKFFAGITKLQDEDFQEIVISETGKANRDQLFLLHCLFEAHNPAISQKAAEKMKFALNLNNMLLNTTDCLCAAYIVTAAVGEWVIDLRGCNIGIDGLRIFESYLSGQAEASETAGAEFRIKLFNLTRNRITAEAITYLASMVRKNIHLASINLASNRFGDTGMRELSDALTDNNTTTALHFSSCDLTSAGGTMLAEMLERNRTIKEIYLGFEPQIGDRGISRLAAALTVNVTLTELSLTNTGMKTVGLSALADTMAVNNKLEVIRLDRNELGAEECRLVARIIEKNNSIILIDLSKNPIGNEGFEILLDALIAKPTSSLKKLGVFGCQITHVGLTKLVQFFSVTETFVGIQLGCNKLGDKGAELVGKALLANASKTVKQVLLETTGISDEGKQKLKQICDSINGDRDQDDKLDLNYLHHSQVVQKRNATNYL